jgi:hypothetical protein
MKSKGISMLYESDLPDPLHIFAQTEIIRGINPTDALDELQQAPGGAGTRLTLFSGSNAKELMKREDLRLRLTGLRPAVFCSLQVANDIKRNHPQLARGVILPRDFLQHETYSALIDPQMLLNPQGLYLPWGKIPSHKAMIQGALGNDIFMRPASPMKPFTGFRLDISNIEAEHLSHTRISAISPEEMIFLAPGKDLPDVEYRVWVIEGEPVTSAGYSWTDIGSPRGKAPDAVMSAAKELARQLQYREDCYTADFVVLNGQPKLVELNAISTSGWYPGMSCLSVFRSLEAILV